MENETKMEEWMYDFAWRGRDIAQQTNDRLDTKAMNIINFSSLLIPIITGILLYFIDKPFFPGMRSLWVISLVLLLLSILFAFIVFIDGSISHPGRLGDLRNGCAVIALFSKNPRCNLNDPFAFLSL